MPHKSQSMLEIHHFSLQLVSNNINKNQFTCNILERLLQSVFWTHKNCSNVIRNASQYKIYSPLLLSIQITTFCNNSEGKKPNCNSTL